MDGYLDLGIDPDHRVIQVGMVLHQSLRFPRRRHEDRVDSAAYRRSKDVADLQADEEGEGYHNYFHTS